MEYINRNINTSFYVYLNPLRVWVSLIRNRDLIWVMTKRNIFAKHKGSYLGGLWAVLNPLMMMALFSFVFGVIFKARYGVVEYESGADFAVAIYLSLSIYQIVADALGNSPALIVGSQNLVKKIVFPLEVLPVASVFASIFYFFISLAIALVFMLYLGHIPSLKALMFPLLMLPVIFMALGISWGFSAVGVFLRDLQHTTQFLSMLLLYGSAVFYSISQLPETAQTLLELNPLAIVIEQSRNMLMWDGAVDYAGMAYVYFVSLMVLFLGYAMFCKSRPVFADVI